ncbi:MAG: ribosomal RNA small subunit methyltransferase E [Phycisphaerales bacterium]|nr:MAG: ribosomal RNA small subunit methyltransferase E [Phycisphaerales bacterium]
MVIGRFGHALKISDLPRWVFSPILDEMHAIIVQNIPQPGQTMAITGEQARHAVRVRRMLPGEPILLMDGRGTVAQAIVAGSDKHTPDHAWRLLADVQAVVHHPPPSPPVHVLCPAPKGALLEAMIDQLSQVGAASWRPLDTQRSQREPRSGRIERLERIAQESAKQCHRPWLLQILPPIGLDQALALPNAVLASPGAPPPHAVLGHLAGPPEHRDHGPTPDRPATGRLEQGIHVLVGPEGGFSDQERIKAQDARLAFVGLGPHVLRIGTAAVVAAAGFVQALGYESGNRQAEAYG